MLCPTCHSPTPDAASVCPVCAAPLNATTTITPDALAAGTRLQGGALVLDAVLGIGGFGITYRGQDAQLHRAVAVKEFFPYGCRRDGTNVQPPAAMPESEFQTARQRFLDEAKTLAQFRHPGIVDVYSLFEENNTAYMVMEFLAGKTLLSVVEGTRTGLSEAGAVAYIKQAGAALQEVHRAGMLHRDIKPENIMVCGDGRVVLIDFGTAREYMAGRTQRHSVVVTPGYAPLEQYAQRAQRGTYTDVYALAATLYYLLTGQIPDAASDRAMGVQLTPIRQFNARVSASVVAAVEAGLSIEVNRRPQRVEDFLRLLDRSAADSEDTIARAISLHQPGLLWPSATVSEPSPNLIITTPARLDAVPAWPPTLHRRKGHWEVKVYDPQVKWPDMCACCGAPSTTFVPLRDWMDGSPLQWPVPYCARCQQHVLNGQRGDDCCTASVALGAIEISLISLAGDTGLLAHPLSTSEIELVAAPALLMCVIGLMTLVRAKHLTTRSCRCMRRAVRHEAPHNQNWPVFSFQNKQFAEAFLACNTSTLLANN